MTINKQQFIAWIAALRSGEYNQASGQLEVDEPYGKKRCCCLGVACYVTTPVNLLIMTDNKLVGGSPVSQRNSPKWLREINRDFERKAGFTLSRLNDVPLDCMGTFTFDEIADVLEAVYLYNILDNAKNVF